MTRLALAITYMCLILQNSSGAEYFITIGTDGNFHNGCNTWHPAGWNQCDLDFGGIGTGSPLCWAGTCTDC